MQVLGVLYVLLSWIFGLFNIVLYVFVVYLFVKFIRDKCKHK